MNEPQKPLFPGDERYAPADAKARGTSYRRIPTERACPSCGGYPTAPWERPCETCGGSGTAPTQEATASPKPAGTLERDECRSCGAPIVWVQNATTKRRLPVDPDPVPDGPLIRASTHTVQFLKANEDPGNRRRYNPHHRTCPNADEWRGKTRADKT